MSNKPSIDDYINGMNVGTNEQEIVKKKHQTDTDFQNELRSRGMLPRRGKNRQHPIRPEVNYNRPLNRLVIPKREIKTSPKTMRGLRFQNLYGKPKEVKK
tara:strand:+ start:51 stop:350 length:300 start_codon:yes stop_codon:yes gene_type:complete